MPLVSELKTSGAFSFTLTRVDPLTLLPYRSKTYPHALMGIGMRLASNFLGGHMPRNFVAKYAKRSGAGSHTARKYSRKQKHKEAL
jgi:hypothetical protein